MNIRAQSPQVGKHPWQAPELVRMGTMRDIAGRDAALAQAHTNKRS